MAVTKLAGQPLPAKKCACAAVNADRFAAIRQNYMRPSPIAHVSAEDIVPGFRDPAPLVGVKPAHATTKWSRGQ